MSRTPLSSELLQWSQNGELCRSCMGEISYHVDQELEDGSQRFQFRLRAVQYSVQYVHCMELMLHFQIL